MNNKPDFIDNLNGNTMLMALRQLLGETVSDNSLFTNSTTSIDEARIATAYFSPEGFSRIADAIKNVPSIKLLLGTDPIANSEHWKRKLDENEERFISRKLKEKLKAQEESLRSE